MDQATVEIETDEASHPFVQVFTAQGMEEMGLDAGNAGGPLDRAVPTARSRCPMQKRSSSMRKPKR